MYSINVEGVNVLRKVWLSMYIKCIDWTQSLAYVWTGSAQGFFKSMDYIQYRTVEIYGQIMKAASQPTVFIY
jgi:hypothetical protein